MFEDSLQERAEQLAERMFIGGDVRDFERMGLSVLDVLLREGMRPDSRVLDVGCGALRIGYWLMRFLDPGRYFGIEPNVQMREAGVRELAGADLVERSRSRFDSNDRFDFSVFGERFDYLVARSIFTHASRAQISAALASFAATGAPGAVFMASYYPAGKTFELTNRLRVLENVASAAPLDVLSPLIARIPPMGSTGEYEGEQWVGRSHESDEPGVIHYSLRWLSGEAAAHGLKVQLMPYPVYHRQYWLRFTAA